LTTQENLKTLGLTFGAVALGAVLGLAQSEALEAFGQPRVETSPAGAVGPVERSGEHGSESHFLVSVVEDQGIRGELEYKLTLTSRFLGPDAGNKEASVEPVTGAFKFAYYFACDSARAVAEPGFCDGLSRDVRQSDVVELGLFESFSEVIEIPDALPDGFYLLQVTVAGSSGPKGTSAVFIDESHFLSVDGRSRSLSINQFYAHSGANQLISEHQGSVTPVVVDAVDPVVDPINSVGTLENR